MSSNPILQDKHLNAQMATSTLPSPPEGSVVPAGPLDTGGQLTIEGVITKSLLLITIVLAAGVVGWNTVEAPVEFEPVDFPGWILLAVLGGVALVFASYKMPHLAKFLAPAYAVVQGLIVGAISHVYEIQYDGIVLQAVLATIGVFVSMLALHLSRAFRITPKIRKGVMIATGGLMLVYLFQVIMNLFGTNFEVPYLHESGPVGILLSLAIIALASFNLLVDFDFIERAEQQSAPKPIEWSAALGLLVTLIWLYFEMLRLLSKLR
ncbi:MAG: Bax inhibitor-1/YccA family protein [Acidobacteria bacterium]|nr:Bax inhibitor-1/YccA family protein [Acidobacteriota bacterium]